MIKVWKAKKNGRCIQSDPSIFLKFREHGDKLDDWKDASPVKMLSVTFLFKGNIPITFPF